MASLNISSVLTAKITQVEFTNKSLEFEHKIAEDPDKFVKWIKEKIGSF